MTRKEKLEFIKDKEKRLAGASPEYKAGREFFSGDVMMMTYNPYREYTPDEKDLKQKYKDWSAGFEDAYYLSVIKKELETIVPVTFQQVLDLPRQPKEDWNDYKICSLIEHHMFAGLESRCVYIEDSKFERVDIETIFFDNGDGERTRTVGVVSFDGIDIMLYNHAGRGSYEYSNEFIINKDVYRQAVLYIHSVIMDHEEENDLEVFDVNDDAERLINFYGARLEIVNTTARKD
jgi:hypothetical protein